MQVGSIHGRFQPFHNAHLAYARAALARVDHLYIGLTRVFPDPGIGAATAPHRQLNDNNPLTYYDRCSIIRASIMDSGIDLSRISIGPFPIEIPYKIHEFWPRDFPCYTTIVDDWNREKIKILENHGHQVMVLDNVVPNGLPISSGSEIRRMIRDADPSWKSFVSQGAVGVIERLVHKFRG